MARRVLCVAGMKSAYLVVVSVVLLGGCVFSPSNYRMPRYYQSVATVPAPVGEPERTLPKRTGRISGWIGAGAGVETVGTLDDDLRRPFSSEVPPTRVADVQGGASVLFRLSENVGLGGGINYGHASDATHAGLRDFARSTFGLTTTLVTQWQFAERWDFGLTNSMTLQWVPVETFTYVDPTAPNPGEEDFQVEGRRRVGKVLPFYRLTPGLRFRVAEGFHLGFGSTVFAAWHGDQGFLGPPSMAASGRDTEPSGVTFSAGISGYLMAQAYLGSYFLQGTVSARFVGEDSDGSHLPLHALSGNLVVGLELE